MKIAVTGAGGLVGSHLARHFARSHEVLALKHGDLDITDEAAVNRIIASAEPSLVVNCAVNAVDDCEREPERARAINVEGPRDLAQAAARVGAEFIHFSTNYVFDGEEVGRAPYTIEDEPRPVNVYGKAKVAGEKAVREACPRTYIIRTSWVYGRGKESFLCVVHADLLSKNRVRAIADIWSSTTYVADLAHRIGEILAVGRYGTYHVVNGGVCSYYEFALEAGRLVGLSRNQLDPLIEVVREDQMQRPAPRPRYTPMRCLLSERLGLPPLRDWRAALADYVGSTRPSPAVSS